MREGAIVTIAGVIQTAASLLAEAGSETPRLDAEVLVRHVLGLDRAALFMRLREPIAAGEADAFAQLVARRIKGEPIAYITGTKEFMGLPFAVGPGVLIPRPETELLVEWGLTWLRARPTAQVMDVGTGSGAIAVSLAALLPDEWHGRIIAADVSTVALGWTRKNRAALLKPPQRHRLNLVRGSLLAWCGGPVDLILANLPYLTPGQIHGNHWLDAEPALALDGGADGLDLIRQLVADAPRVLAPGGAVALEIDPGQADTTAALLTAHLPGATVGILPDLAGLSRHVIATAKSGDAKVSQQARL